MKFKHYIYIIVTFLVIGLGIGCSTLYTKTQKQQIQIENAINNIKAYENENSELKDKNIEYQLTVDQLNASTDTLTQELNKVRKQLKIKDRDIQRLEYLASQTQKTDSIYVKDTIFVKDMTLDTLLRDNWSSLQLHLEYPNEVVANYSFNNKTVVASASKKVTVDPPKKCWIGRLFQKKQTIIETEVKELNPYAITKDQRFINIVK